MMTLKKIQNDYELLCIDEDYVDLETQTITQGNLFIKMLPYYYNLIYGR